MNANGRHALGIAAGISAGVVLDLLAAAILLIAFLASRGQGGDGLCAFIFPFGGLALRVLSAHNPIVAFASVDDVCLWVQGLQWPFYGTVLGIAWARKKLGTVAIILLFLHLAAWAGAAALGGYTPENQPHFMC